MKEPSAQATYSCYIYIYIYISYFAEQSQVRAIQNLDIWSLEAKRCVQSMLEQNTMVFVHIVADLFLDTDGMARRCQARTRLRSITARSQAWMLRTDTRVGRQHLSFSPLPLPPCHTKMDFSYSTTTQLKVCVSRFPPADPPFSSFSRPWQLSLRCRHDGRDSGTSPRYVGYLRRGTGNSRM